MEATVSDEDYEWAARFHWYVNVSGGRAYVMSHGIKTESGGASYLHREITQRMGADETKKISFRDRNSLNCTRKNLVSCNHADAIRSQKISKRNTSGYRGVSRIGSKWRASICVDGKRIHLGTFISAELAARAYDIAAAKYFGEFATINLGG